MGAVFARSPLLWVDVLGRGDPVKCSAAGGAVTIIKISRLVWIAEELELDCGAEVYDGDSCS